MEKQRLLPDKMKILSGSMLKLIAVLTMLIDHTASYLLPRSFVLFSVAGKNIYLYPIMRAIGRLAFPLFAFLLVEGFIHTRNRVRYGVSLIVCAALSEIPWNLVHSGKLMCPSQNVFFTLLLGFAGLCVIDKLKDHPIIETIVLIGLGALSVAAKADFAVLGYAFIILIYALRNYEIFRVMTAFLLKMHWYALIAFLPISMYNGKRGFIKGPVLKYAFYAFYPVHLLVFYFIKLSLGHFG